VETRGTSAADPSAQKTAFIFEEGDPMPPTSTRRPTLSRRDFGKLAALLAGAAVFPFANEATLAQIAVIPGGLPQGAIRIDSNENPAGPCQEALDALIAIAKDGGRYHMHLTDSFCETLARSENVKTNYVRAYAGSSPALHLSVIAFCGPDKPLITGDPGYEAGSMAAGFIGAKNIKIPLTRSYALDVKAMVAAANNAPALFYIANPNNPTGTATPREDIEWLLAHKPAGSTLLLDEAYIHISNEKTCTDLVAQDKDLIILRTFSKLYGMAGLRAGAAIARPDLLQKLSNYVYAPQATTAMVAATASLKVPTLVAERRKLITDTREETIAFLKEKGFAVVPSVSNKFMVDTRRPSAEIIAALRRERVYIGRPWSIWPTHVRISVGTREEMQLFRQAFLKVTA
jgi:histidinol-phosphate/aromatic aminotransferase/cobyric acid decarboxylase-like protein